MTTHDSNVEEEGSNQDNCLRNLLFVNQNQLFIERNSGVNGIQCIRQHNHTGEIEENQLNKSRR